MNIRFLLKLCSSMLIIIVFTAIFANYYVFGTDSRFKFTDFEDSQGSSDAQEWLENSAGTIIIVVRIVTTSIALIILLVISIKYMISAPGERADIKKHAVPYVIGVIILFGTSGILSIIQKLSTVLDDSAGTQSGGEV